MKNFSCFFLFAFLSLNLLAQDVTKDADFRRLLNVTEQLGEQIVNQIDGMSAGELNAKVTSIEHMKNNKLEDVAKEFNVSEKLLQQYVQISQVLQSRYSGKNFRGTSLEDAARSIRPGMFTVGGDIRTVEVGGQVIPAGNPCVDAYRECRSTAIENSIKGMIQGGVEGGGAGGLEGAVGVAVLAIAQFYIDMSACLNELKDCLN